MGQSKQSGNLVICNRKKLASPMGFVCGKPGSGKSFSVKREITNTVLAYPEDEIIIFDPAGEYGNLIEALGGVNVRLAPMRIPRSIPSIWLMWRGAPTPRSSPSRSMPSWPFRAR